jgi:isoleucyl-tRNA synthetase
MAPISPFFSDELFLRLNQATGRHAAASVHHVLYPTAQADAIDAALEQRMALAQQVCSLVLSIRKKENIKVRQPLQKVLIPVLNPAMKAQLERVEDLIKAEVNVKEIDYLTETEGFIRKKVKPNYARLGKKLGPLMKAVSAALATFTDRQIAALEGEGTCTITVQDQTIALRLEEVEIVAEDVPGWSVASAGSVTVALDISLTDALRQEGNAREFVNRLQNIRKDTGLQVTDRIQVVYHANDVIKTSLDIFKTYICAEILADTLEWVPELNGALTIEVNEAEIKVQVNKKEE